ncbi:MAG: UDP-N-acetylglucosamine acyltransferase [Candidatus Bathyarchaeota archaeon BA2]|nr:MAG: UDP-N-acetylglucosamine acyltransferase [Candidatus Bathyarchaeota archaeon BA2]
MNKVYIHPTAVVDKTAIIGDGTKVWHFVHVRENAEIGRECVLGHSVYVGEGVKIGNRVKLENRANVYPGVKIEDKVFVGPHVTFVNDPYPRSFSTDWRIVPTLVKKGASIGTGTVVMCGATIGEYAMIGAGSVVTRDVQPHAIAYGNPAEVRGFACKCGRKLKEEEKKQKFVLMKCLFCGEKYKIPAENYAKIRKNKG